MKTRAMLGIILVPLFLTCCGTETDNRIVFVDPDEIFVVNADGSALARLSNSRGSDQLPRWYDQAPAWSPDYRQIALLSNRDGNWQIYSMNADGTDQKQLTHSTANLTCPVWSPDGKKIAFCVDDAGHDICVINADGTGYTCLTEDDKGRHYSPAWSPDSRRIAFVVSGPFVGSEQGIYIMNADGTNKTCLPNTSFAHSGFGPPVWSPDGKKIAFSLLQGNETQISVINADGTNLTQLTTAGGYHAVWSPDGKKIAFVSERDGKREIYVMYSDGTSQIRLTNNQNQAQLNQVIEWPAWSPDGERIVFVSNGQLYVMNADGSQQIRLTDENAVYGAYCPVWAFVSAGFVR